LPGLGKLAVLKMKSTQPRLVQRVLADRVLWLKLRSAKKDYGWLLINTSLEKARI
jgi:hypothetical protein